MIIEKNDATHCPEEAAGWLIELKAKIDAISLKDIENGVSINLEISSNEPL